MNVTSTKSTTLKRSSENPVTVFTAMDNPAVIRL